jgi:type IV secretion system protein VirB10
MAVVSEADRIDLDPAAAFRLRSAAPPVMRLSRKVLGGFATVGAVMILGGMFYSANQRNGKLAGGSELAGAGTKAKPDGLSDLPQDYSMVLPGKLPPPLPTSQPRGQIVHGEIGQPIPVAGTEGVDPEEGRLAQEAEAARTSQLFAGGASRSAAGGASDPAPGGLSGPAPERKISTGQAEAGLPLDSGSMQNMQDRKMAFVNGPTDHRAVSPDRLETPVSRYVIQAGTVIPAALITGVRSDLPGQVIAQVTQNVYDSPTGRYRVIPQGAKLIGVYDSQVAFGQDRLLLTWNRLIMPDGRSIALERQPGTDTQGFTGLEDDVDQHWSRLAMGAVLSTVLGIGAEIGTNANTSSIASALQQGSGSALSQTGSQLTQRNLNIPPTITIRPGFPMRVIINRDLVLTPYQGPKT